ncbi:unnamed protein product [Caenorhabditis sp. 36 PRJEB53466]|nr:unnamed protein product [Caenorhabditis sp. 36 PRJEB53466]
MDEDNVLEENGGQLEFLASPPPKPTTEVPAAMCPHALELQLNDLQQMSIRRENELKACRAELARYKEKSAKDEETIRALRRELHKPSETLPDDRKTISRLMAESERKSRRIDELEEKIEEMMAASEEHDDMIGEEMELMEIEILWQQFRLEENEQTINEQKALNEDQRERIEMLGENLQKMSASSSSLLKKRSHECKNDGSRTPELVFERETTSGKRGVAKKVEAFFRSKYEHFERSSSKMA